MSGEKILAPIFEKSLSLDRGGDTFGTRALSLWERMADTLDQIAANTRDGGLTRAITASLSRASGAASPQSAPSPQVAAPASASTAAALPAAPVAVTKSQQASAADREERAAERQGSVIAEAVAGGLGKLGTWGKSGVDAVRDDSDARDAAGYAIAGPLYGVAKELREALPDSMKERLESRKERGDAGNQGKDENGKKRDARGRFLPDRDTVRRETARIEIAEDELALQEREAKVGEKRHKELVRAIRTSGGKGLLDRFAERRGGRDRVIRERGGRDRVVRERGRGSRDIDLNTGHDRGRGRGAARDAGRRGGLSRLGRLGRTGGAAAGTLATGAAAGGGLLRGAGRAAAGAGRGIALGAKGALGAARAIPVAGQLLAAGLALYDGFQGWNDTEMQRKAFGLAEGQEATTGQKASAAIANALDLGGLGTGLLGLLGVDVDTADIARNIYALGDGIATAGRDFVAAFGEKASAIWGGMADMGARIWSGAQEIGGALSSFASSALEQGTSLLSGLWEGAKSVVDDIWTSLGSFARDSLAEAGEMLSGLWKSASELPGRIADKANDFASDVVAGAKDVASSAIEEGGKLLSSGWEAVKDFGGNLIDSLFGPSEAKATEPAPTPANPQPEPQPVKAPAQPGASAGLLSASLDTQEEMNEAMSSVDEAMRDQNKLLSSIDKSLDTMPDTYGIAGALGGVQDAIRSVRTGGNGGYVRTGASGGKPGFAYNPDSQIGDTIAHEESGAQGVKAIGYDRHGGTSYGKWQLSSRQGGLEEWLQLLEKKGGESAEIAKRLRAAGPTNTGGKSGAFVDAYLKEAAANSELFESTQRESLLKHNYNPAMARLQSDSLKAMIEGDKSLQEMLFSTAVQHGGGGAAKILNGVYREGMSREDLIRAVYAKRGGQFGSSTAQVQQAALNRMDRERDLILGMDRGEANVRQLRERMSKGGSEAVQAGVSTMIAEATEDAKSRNVKYQMGGKNSSEGAIDCSGWVQELGNQLMAGMNAAMGEEVFSADARRAFNKGARNEGAAGIVRAVSEQTGQLYTNEQLAPELAKEGMVIGLDTGHQGWEAGRFKDIDHVVQTYRDPATGELMVSESRGGKGVMSSRYADWYAQQQARGTKLYGADLTAMADAGKVAPVQPAALADGATVQPGPPVQPAQPVLAEHAASEQREAPPAQRANQSTALAESASVVPAPESVPRIAPEIAQSGRRMEPPESVRTILPPEAMSGNGKGDNTALLAILGKILAAIEAGNREMASAAAGGGDETPSIGMDYDDPAIQSMARDFA